MTGGFSVTENIALPLEFLLKFQIDFLFQSQKHIWNSLEWKFQFRKIDWIKFS